MNDSYDLSATKHSQVEFLRTEIDTGLTMANIARKATHNDKKERNRTNARKAYDAILRFLPQSNLKADEEDQIKCGLAKLEAELRQLGEEL